MFNKIISLAVIAIATSTLSCSSCEKVTPLPDAQVVDSACETPQEQVVSGDSWEVTLPSGWEKRELSHPGMVLLAANQATETLVVMTKEKYVKTFDQFALESLRKLRGEGASLDETSKATIHEVPFVIAETTKNKLRMLMWVTVKDGFGYELSCGGPEGNPQSISDCQKIATSLKLH